MIKFPFPQPFKHVHPPVQDINKIIDAQLTIGQKASDWVASNLGSWWFIILQTAILMAWVVMNVLSWYHHWDPYPFIFMNLILSLQAAYAAPIIMMSQNRQAARDRLEAHNDYQVNQKAEEEIRAILDHLMAQDNALIEIHRLLDEMRQEKWNKDSC
ncbi:MAG: DUF1003 domain-containing protein [Deltaproteobacteria bacterium]|nr:DUF1003 domain-containing protein [Deltaproteobacteria bacterium]